MPRGRSSKVESSDRKNATTTATEGTPMNVTVEKKDLTPSKGRYAGKTVRDALVIRAAAKNAQGAVSVDSGEFAEYMLNNLNRNIKVVVYKRNSRYDGLNAALFGASPAQPQVPTQPQAQVPAQPTTTKTGKTPEQIADERRANLAKAREARSRKAAERKAQEAATQPATQDEPKDELVLEIDSLQVAYEYAKNTGDWSFVQQHLARQYS